MKIIIIGAGIGGLGLANLLVRDGHEVHVYEQQAQPGGRAGKLARDGFTFDTGPSWYLMPEVFERFYSSIGEDITQNLDIIRLSPSYKVFFEHDSPIVITGNLAKDKVTFSSIEVGADRGLERYARRASQLYDLALRYFLYTNFNKPKDFLKPGILARLPRMLYLMLTPIHRYVSTFVRTTRLQQILEYPMVFLGTSPFEAPALYSLMGALDFNSGVYYPRGGIYTIINNLHALAEHAGVQFHFSTPVQSIITKGGRATGISLADNSVVDADVVISNADLHYTESTLVPPEYRSYPESYWQQRHPSCSALLIYLGIRGSIPELEHHNLLFVDEWRENFNVLYKTSRVPRVASLYLSRTSATDPNVAPDGHETLFVLVPLPAGNAVSNDSAEQLATHYISQIETMTGVTLQDRIVTQQLFTPEDFGTVFHSWQNSMLGPSHILRQSAFWRTSNRSKRLKNLYYVGAGTTPGIGLPMCLISAANVAERIKAEQS